jgi:hypothetical protein
MRLVLTVPEEQLREACQRIKDFCKRYHRSEEGTSDADTCNSNKLVKEANTNIDALTSNKLTKYSTTLKESHEMIITEEDGITS